MELHQGGSGGGEEKGGGHGAAPQGSRHRPELLELREHFNSILRHGVWTLGSPVESGVGRSDLCVFLLTQDVL